MPPAPLPSTRVLRRLRSAAAVLAAACLVSCSGGGGGSSAPAPPDPPAGEPSFNVAKTGFDNQVTDVDTAPDGDLLIVGNFNSFGGTISKHLVRLEPNGSVDTGFVVGQGFNANVLGVVAATDGSGDVYAVGEFTAYVGTGVNRVVRLDPDATIDAGFAIGSGFDGDANTIASAADGSGDVYVGGAFTTYQGLSSNRLVRIDPDGSIDAGFSVGTGFDGEVHAVLPAADGSGDLYVAGAFTMYRGAPANRVVRLNADGSRDGGFAVGTGFDGDVLALALAADGDLLAGGAFTSYAGSASGRLARLDPSGAIDAAFAVGVGFDGPVHSIAPVAGGRVVVGGFFGTYQAVGSANAIQLASDASIDASLDVGAGFNLFVNVIEPLAGGDLLVGGAFSGYDGVGTNRIVRLAPTGSVDPDLAVGAGFDFVVDAIAAAPDGGVLVGGSFSHYAGRASRSLVRLDDEGALDAAFDTGTAFDDVVTAIAPARDGSGDVYVGGAFTSFDGVGANRIVRLDADGARDTAFAIGAGFDGDVAAIAVAADGDVYVVGAFISYAGNAVGRVVRLDPDGSVDAGFVTGAGFDGAAAAIALADDGSGDVYVGGTFTTYDGAAASRIVRLEPNGSRDPSFVTGSGFDGAVLALAALGDGSGGVFAAGAFTDYDGAGAGRVLRLAPDGSIDTSFATGAAFNNEVRALAAAPGGGLYAAGVFTSYDGEPLNRIVRIDATGARDSGFAIGEGPENTVTSLALAPDGDLFVGGQFALFDGVRVDYAVKLEPDGSLE